VLEGGKMSKAVDSRAARVNRHKRVNWGKATESSKAREERRKGLKETSMGLVSDSVSETERGALMLGKTIKARKSFLKRNMRQSRRTSPRNTQQKKNGTSWRPCPPS